MEPYSSNRSQHPPQQYQHGYQQAATSDGQWDPIAPTPEVNPPVLPPVHRRVSFFSSLRKNKGGSSPASIGLGIEQQSSTYQRVREPGPYASPPLDDFKSPYPQYPFQREQYVGTPGTPAFYPSHRDSSPDGSDKTPSPPQAGPSRWSWSFLNAPWVMYALFCLGVVFAGSHHAFYASLHGKPADDQLKMMRFGGFLSYAAKASLVSAVLFGYRQQVWVTVRRKQLRLKTIDSIFSASQDLSALLNLEFLKKAKVALVLALVAWLFPLVVILTPSSLTIAPREEWKLDQCRSVRTLNFEPEKVKDWRKADKINGYNGYSLSLWNCTMKDQASNFGPFNETYFDYWDQSSQPLQLLTTLTALSGNIVPRENIGVETCGRGWNCSYTINFEAPGYKCEALGSGKNIDDEALAKQGAPFNSTDLLPKGDFGYIGNTMLGEYQRPQMEDVGEAGAPESGPPFPKNFGVLRTEPVVWIGHATPTRPNEPIPTVRDAPGFETAWEPHIFRCEHYLTNYEVQFNLTSTSQTTKVLSRKYLRPIIDTRFINGTLADDGTNDTTVATPESNYIRPLDVENNRITAAYHSLGYLFRAILFGHIKNVPFPAPVTDALNTRLVDQATHLPVANFMEAAQSFYENITLSLLSNPQFVIVTWAGNNAKRSGIQNHNGPYEEYPGPTYTCTKSRIFNAYHYIRRDLWIAYALAILFAMICVGLGTAALAQNNYHVRDIKVSSIVAATRAPCLEDLPWKSSKWGEVPWEIKQTQLGYGIIRDVSTPGLGSIREGQMMSPDLSSNGLGNGKVYYGFAPPEVLDRTRAATFGPGTPRPRASPFSFKTWEH
ncbi:hypothetical protein QBC35DRAFT_195727 [Podospora australis]|uniref:Formylmethionine deformylase-like protein n=1 Tax=Podospora australis TaxID=1536484 RepID=A0AAN6WW70_9PEZI|nr:hypothetical protein QBC35DRAFT_195727 [Podospora australis]